MKLTKVINQCTKYWIIVLTLNLLQQYFSGSSFVIYFLLYNDDKNICDNIPWEREKIKFIGLVGPMGRRGCLSTFTVHLYLMFYYCNHPKT